MRKLSEVPRNLRQFLPAVLAIPIAVVLASKADEWSPGFVFGGLVCTSLILVGLAHALARGSGADGTSSTNWLSFVALSETPSARIARLESAVNNLTTQLREAGASSRQVGLEGREANLASLTAEAEAQVASTIEATYRARAADLAREITTIREGLEAEKSELRELMRNQMADTHAEIEGLRGALARLESRRDSLTSRLPARASILYRERELALEMMQRTIALRDPAVYEAVTRAPAVYEAFTRDPTMYEAFTRDPTMYEAFTRDPATYDELVRDAAAALLREASPSYRATRWDTLSSAMHMALTVREFDRLEIRHEVDPAGQESVRIIKWVGRRRT